MKKLSLWCGAWLWAMMVSAATTYHDATGDVDPGIGDGSGTLDIVSVEVSHTDSNLVFALTVDGSLAVTDFGKYMIGMSVPPKMAEAVARAVCEQWLGA